MIPPRAFTRHMPIRMLARLGGLERFVAAQAPYIDEIELELLSGKKRTHWIWFVFPQLKGLGASERSRFYALTEREARRYAEHPLLGARLRAHTQVVRSWRISGRTLDDIFGPDAQKFRSSMLLFSEVTGEALFEEAR